MSFRTNLQYLRAERHMTQEQLAMLLGVSRQSVTKWEAEKSYPEMDKLIKMCQIFECSLDDLVQGDVSRRAAVSQSAADGVQNDGNAVVRVEAPHGRNSLSDIGSAFVPAIPVGPNTDVCGYDEHMVAFARKVALGVALIILGVAAAVFTDEVLHSDGIVLMALFALVAAGLGFLIPSGMEHAAFVEAHPYVADFYTAEQKAAERRRASIAIVSGIEIILLGIAVSALFEVEANVQVIWRHADDGPGRRRCWGDCPLGHAVGPHGCRGVQQGVARDGRIECGGAVAAGSPEPRGVSARVQSQVSPYSGAQEEGLRRDHARLHHHRAHLAVRRCCHGCVRGDRRPVLAPVGRR